MMLSYVNEQPIGSQCVDNGQMSMGTVLAKGRQWANVNGHLVTNGQTMGKWQWVM